MKLWRSCLTTNRTETVLGLFRHGQTDWNIDFRLQGTTDIPLNDHGQQQVKRALPHLRSMSWDILLTSPLTRAQQTAAILRGALNFASFGESQLLLERSFGIGEGLTYAEWQETYASLDEIPGAESSTSVSERSRALLSWVATEFAGKRVLAVSHGALIRYVLSEVSGGSVPPPGERLQNASLHVLTRADTSWNLERWAPETLGLGSVD